MVTAAGGLVAVAIAITASPLTPIGAARLAEPAPGVQVNLAVLAAGFAVLALVPLVLLVPVAWRGRGPGRRDRSAWPSQGGRAGVSRLGAAGGRGRAGDRRHRRADGVRAGPRPDRGAGAQRPDRARPWRSRPCVAAAGVRHQPDRPGRHPAPVRAELAQELDLGFGGVPAALAAKLLAAEPAVDRVCGRQLRPAQRGRQPAPSCPPIGIAPVRGRDFLTLLAGRAPASPGEIALGAQTMRARAPRLGQTVRVAVNQVATRPRMAAPAG